MNCNIHLDDIPNSMGNNSFKAKKKKCLYKI